MIEEAVAHGLSVDRRTVSHLAWGKPRKGSPFTYVEPAFDKKPHNSMSRLWRSLEWFPKSDRYKECVERASLLGYYIPNAEPRAISVGSLIHESVASRMHTIPDYQPMNLLERYSIVPFKGGPH
jgi:hypothetical protein